MTVPEKALQWALRIADDQTHGYSQASRWGPDYDCSSFAISAYKIGAGVPIDTSVVNYTGNMQYLTRYGFKEVSVNFNTGSGLQKGDILYYHISGTNGHTALYAGNGRIVHARGQSYGSARTGDQGSEIAVTQYSRSRWQHVLRYAGTKSEAKAPKRYSVTASLPIIKYGSVNRCVKIWQDIIGVESDGEFGQNTLAATLAFQRSHNLEDDGEVGPKTWAAGLNTVE